jgi:VanZ family protein
MGTVLRWLAAGIYAFGIFVASSIPGHSMPVAQLFSFDKVVHFCVFLGLGALLSWAWERHWPAILACVAYGGLDEIHQHFTPNRSVEWGDFLADTLGAATGVLAVYLLATLVQRYRRRHAADPPVS